MSFSNAGLGIGHALAHSLGGRYDVVHGMVHPMLLPPIMRFNIPSCTDKMATIAQTINGVRLASAKSLAEQGCATLEHMFAELRIPVRLRDIVPDESRLEQICRIAVQDACAVTNPRQATWRDLYEICGEAW
jgi:alcohol dehydrogenase